MLAAATTPVIPDNQVKLPSGLDAYARLGWLLAGVLTVGVVIGRFTKKSC